MMARAGRRTPIRLDETFESGRSRFVVAVFENLEDAEAAVGDLEGRGYDPAQISVFLSEETRRELGDEHGIFIRHGDRVVTDRTVVLQKKRKVLEGAGAGSAIGGSLGALGAALTAAGTSVVFPPLGIAVAGPLAAALAGAGAGGVAGGVVGALTGAGMSEYRADRFESYLRRGFVGVAVEARNEDEAAGIEGALGTHDGRLVPRR